MRTEKSEELVDGREGVTKRKEHRHGALEVPGETVSTI